MLIHRRRRRQQNEGELVDGAAVEGCGFPSASSVVKSTGWVLVLPSAVGFAGDGRNTNVESTKIGLGYKVTLAGSIGTIC